MENFLANIWPMLQKRLFLVLQMVDGSEMVVGSEIPFALNVSWWGSRFLGFSKNFVDCFPSVRHATAVTKYELIVIRFRQFFDKG